MRDRVLTERQYEVLRGYEACYRRTTFGADSAITARLVARGYLMKGARERGWYQITSSGLAALKAFRERYGVPV